MLRKKVGEIVSPRLVSLTTATPVGQAVDTMREQNISCIVVTEHHRLAGIFTERNIVEYAVQQDFEFSGHTLGEVMSTSVHTVTAEDFIYTAYSHLVKHRIRHLVVIDGDRPRGVLTQSDIVAHLGSEYFVDIKKISQIMSRQLFTTSGQATVQEALQIMAERAISCLVVTEDDRPVGILTERDVARLVGVSRDIRTQPVAKFMSTPVHTVPLEMPVYEAATLLRGNGIRRLVIVDDQGRIEGLTTQSDIVRGLEGKYIEILNQVVREKDSELQDTSRDLREKTTLLNNILRSAVDLGIVSTDLNFRIAYYNPAAEEIMRWPSEDLIGRDLRFQFKNKVDLAQFNRAVDTASRRSPHSFVIDLERKGEVQHIQVRISGIRGEADDLEGFLVMLNDITERRKAEETIQYMAFHDSLTGLLNRGLLEERLAHEIARCRRSKCRLAVMVMDLDRFKDINDTYGHQAGDVLLQTFAVRLKTTLRGSDTIVRMGGDEFLVLLPEIASLEDVAAIGGKVMAALDESIDLEDGSLEVATSIGVSVFPIHGQTGEELIRVADQAMYRAKEHNRSNGRSNLIVAEVEEHPGEG